MPTVGLLLVGAPSRKRDALELCARRHGAFVVLHDQCTSFPDALPVQKLTAVVITCDGKSCDLERHLHTLSSLLSSATIIFSSHVTSKQAASLLKHNHVILIPPLLAAETLEPLLFTTGEENADALPSDGPEKTIVLRRKVYALDFRVARQQFEAEHIARILEHCQGNVSRAVRMMDMARRNLQIKIQAYGIDIERIRSDINC